MQSRRLDKSDIADIRRWQADAARRAVEAGFDIVYVYATHGYLVSEFLNSDTNDRTDEYGGSLANRYRIVRELIDVTRDAVAGKAAVAVRYAADMTDPESFDAFGAMADLPDLWDLNVHDYDVEMGVSRFTGEAALQEHVKQARTMTTKPVVAVGRFTSPDTMARVIREGVQDLIGAARPSIADPFLPKKIEEDRIEDIRECIGCNICYAHNSLGVPIRCTQNPTMGEEHRRGWHLDDDHYYLGPVIALALQARGNAVTLVTPAGRAGQWSSYTNEQHASVRAMLEAGIEIVTNTVVDRVAPGRVTVSCVFTGRRREIGADRVDPAGAARRSAWRVRAAIAQGRSTRGGESALSRAGHHRRRPTAAIGRRWRDPSPDTTGRADSGRWRFHPATGLRCRQAAQRKCDDDGSGDDNVNHGYPGGSKP